MKGLLLKFLQKLLTRHRFDTSDRVIVGSATEIYNVAGLFYNIKLEPVYMLRTKDNKLFEQKDKFCERYTGW